MKDLKHLFLTSCDLGVNLSMIQRFSACSEENAVMSMGIGPNNLTHQECPYFLVTLRRITDKDQPVYDDVHVMGHIIPASVEDLPTLNSIDRKSANVFIVPYHTGQKTRLMRIRKNFVNKFISMQHNGHATKGGVYGHGMFGCEYVGVFRSLPLMYKALKDIYPDL